MSSRYQPPPYTSAVCIFFNILHMGVWLRLPSSPCALTRQPPGTRGWQGLGIEEAKWLKHAFTKRLIQGVSVNERALLTQSPLTLLPLTSPAVLR
jgi:hypothetical protein